MIIKSGKKYFNISNIKKVSFFGEIRGLMFRRRERCPALLFEFDKPVKMRIHSFFLFFSFLVIWLDNKNRIIDKRIIHPWRFSVGINKKYSKIIEIPLNDFYFRIVENIVGQRFK